MIQETTGAPLNRLLVVGDTSANLQLLINLLMEQGYIVHSVLDGESALEFVNSVIPDLILLDVQLPGMDGYEVCRRLMADENTCSIPIIFISILEDEADKVEAFRQGAVDNITKPFHPEEVLARVRTHLRLRELTKSLEKQVSERTEELIDANERLQQEIEERKRAEETLQKSEAKCIVADNTYDWIFWQSPNGKFIYMSPSCERITGYKEKEFVADAGLIHRIVHPDDRDHFADHFSTSHRRQVPGKIEYRLLRRDGTVRWIDHVCQPVFNDRGDYLGIRGSNRDITERKQADANIALLNFSLNKVREEVFLVDEKARFHYVNEETCRVLNYTKEELLGLSVPDINPDYPPERWLPHWQKIKEKRSMVFETRHKTKDGHFVPVEINVNYFEYKGGAYALALVRDIRERKRRDEERARLEEHLRQSQKLETVGLLAGGVAHDFNNILTPILGYTELLIANYTEEDSQYDQLQQIKKAAEHAKRLTHRLLAFGRKQLIELKSVDLGEIICKLEDMLRRTIREDIQIEVTISPSISKVHADVSQIEQVLLNLSLNAQDAMPVGGRLTIEVRDTDLDETYTARHPENTPGSYVMLSVSDTGVGMDEKTLEHIFEPFFTTKGVGKGTGLGLSTVYGIVKQHGGSLAVYSETGQGSTFKIFLPRLAEDTETVKERTPQTDEFVGGIETVLVAEDSKMVRDLTCKMLEDLGYQVLCAEDPDRCIELAHTHQSAIDLLLSDIVMPKMNGKELYRLLNKIRPELRVLFMSGYSSDAIGHHAILDKGVHFLKKPFSLRALAEKVREVLDE